MREFTNRGEMVSAVLKAPAPQRYGSATHRCGPGSSADFVAGVRRG